MADDDFTPDEEAALEQLDPNIRRELREARKLKRQNQDALARAEKAERSLAFRDAGVPNTKLGELFMRGYDGPMDDPEKVKAAAIEYGVIEAPAGAGAGQQPDPEAEARARVAAAAGGAGAGPPSGPDHQAAISSAKSKDELMAAYQAAGGRVSNSSGILPVR